MTKDEIVTIYKGLPILSNLTGAKFAYFVARNQSHMKPEIEAINATLKNSDEFNNYELARVDLARANAKIGEDGKPETQVNAQGQTEFVMKDKAAWDKLFKEFNAKHKKVLDARQKQVDEHNALLKEKSDVKLYKIKMDNVPANISVAQMNVIIDLIEG